jgi:hypothetical protein
MPMFTGQRAMGMVTTMSSAYTLDFLIVVVRAFCPRPHPFALAGYDVNPPAVLTASAVRSWPASRWS